MLKQFQLVAATHSAECDNRLNISHDRHYITNSQFTIQTVIK